MLKKNNLKTNSLVNLFILKCIYIYIYIFTHTHIHIYFCKIIYTFFEKKGKTTKLTKIKSVWHHSLTCTSEKKSCQWHQEWQYNFRHQNCGITPGCWLMRIRYCMCFHTLYNKIWMSRLSGEQDDSSERQSDPLEIWSDILERQETTLNHEVYNRHRIPSGWL